MHTDSDKQTRLPEAETTVASVGARLQEARTRRGWSVHDLAGQADVSAGMISQIERGLANPSFNVLSKISSALGLQLGVFFEERPGLAQDIVVHPGQRRKLRFPDPNFLYELLTPDLNQALEMVWVESAPGSSTEDSPFAHQGEECGLLLQGTLEVHLGDQRFVLHAGDSITFNSTIPHWYYNPGPERVLSVWAITPPSF